MKNCNKQPNNQTNQRNKKQTHVSEKSLQLFSHGRAYPRRQISFATDCWRTAQISKRMQILLASAWEWHGDINLETLSTKTSNDGKKSNSCETQSSQFWCHFYNLDCTESVLGMMPTGLPQMILSPQPLHIALYVKLDDLSNKVMHGFQDQFHFQFVFLNWSVICQIRGLIGTLCVFQSDLRLHCLFHPNSHHHHLQLFT